MQNPKITSKIHNIVLVNGSSKQASNIIHSQHVPTACKAA